MAFENVWIVPLILSAYSLLTVLICLLLSYHYAHLPGRWPFLSEIAIKTPESNVYSLMVNHMAVMGMFYFSLFYFLIIVAVWSYLKHRELISYFSLENHMTKRRILSFFHMCIGMLGAISMQMSVNFPKTKIPYVQTYASLTLLICVIVYVWIHSVFSYFVVDPNIARTRLFLIRACIAAAITSCAANMIKVFELRGHNFDRITPSPLDILPTGAVFEWGVYFSVCLFLLTDAYEFRNLSFTAPKLVIPGSERYDETRLLPNNEPTRNRTVSFTDLPSSALQSSYVW